MYKKLYIFLALSVCFTGPAYGTDSTNIGIKPGAAVEKPEDEQKPKPGIEILNAWARPASAGSNSAVYFTIENKFNTAQNLIGASKLGLANNIELHGTSINKEDGKAVMNNINKILIPANEKILFKPGGMHVMLIGLKKDLVIGETFELDLAFEGETNAKTVKVTVKNDSN